MKKKVLFIHVGEPIPIDKGFVPTRYAVIASQLIRLGYDPIRVAPSFIHRSRTFRNDGEFFDKNFGKFIVVPTADYSNSRSFKRLISTSQYKRGALNAIKVENPEIIVIAINPPGFAAQIRKLVGPEIKIIVDIRDIFPDAQIMTSTGLQYNFFKLILPYYRYRALADFVAADVIFSLSKSYIEWAKVEVGLVDKPTKAIPLGLPARLSALPMLSDRRGVVYVGSLSRILDFELLLDAWKVVEVTVPEIACRHPLQIAGAGPMLAYINKRAQNLNHVNILGFIDQKQAVKIMTQARVGIAPYAKGNFHTMPNKLFDYASAGLPIIATLGGEAKILINNEGLGISNDDARPDWIAKKIIDLLEDDDLWLTFSKSIELISCKYDREVLAKDFIDFMDL